MIWCPLRCVHGHLHQLRGDPGGREGALHWPGEIWPVRREKLRLSIPFASDFSFYFDYVKYLQDNLRNFKHICVTLKYLSVMILLVTFSWSVTLSQLVTLDLMTILWLAWVQQLEKVRASQEGVLRTTEDQMREEHKIQDKPREETGTTIHRLVGWQQWLRYLLVDNVYWHL